jgi:isoleucyl-tRNA synthetase
MPFAQWHYPFENEEKFERSLPADFICEAVDQTRGWFYSLHALSILLLGKPSFRNVICLGHILDSKGEKMSKSKGNVLDPWQVIERYGADALRWQLITSSPPGNSRRLSSDLVADSMRKFLLTLWNTYSFFVIYANIDKFDPRQAGDEEHSELDRWIRSELEQLILDVTDSLDHYDPTTAGRRIEEFVDGLSNWYVRRSRRRFWKSENDADKRAAHATLYHCLVTLSKLLAPFIPFIAEELYQNLVLSFYPQAPESVHLCDFPLSDSSLIDEQLSADTALVMKVSSLGRAARSKAGIKVRQPLAKVVLRLRNGEERESLKRLGQQVLDELNVKEMAFVDGAPSEPGYVMAEDGGYIVAIDTKLTPELAEEGLAREIVHRLQTMRKQADFDIADYIETYYQAGELGRRVFAHFASYIKQETLSHRLIQGAPPQDAYVESHKLGSEEIILAVKR